MSHICFAVGCFECGVCHSNCPFSTATPGHIWTELLYALLHILLFHYTRKQHLREPQMPPHKALSPAEMLSTVQGLASITYAESSTNENSYTENKNVPQGPQQEREGGEQEDYTYARSKALYPVVRPTWYSMKRNLVPQWGPSRPTWPTEAHCEPRGHLRCRPWELAQRCPFGP